VIPATAIRGALRESLESLLRGAKQPACSGGDGRGTPRDDKQESDPINANKQDEAISVCRCKACLLFGTQRDKLDVGERAFSGLILGDARLPPRNDKRDDKETEGKEGPSWGIRPGVGVARKRRAAEDQRLFMQKVPLAGDEPFIATGTLRQPELQSLLVAAVTATKYIGAGRSRGMARVDLSLEWTEPSPVELPSFPSEGDVHIRVTLRSPAIVGIPVISGNVRETRHVIPGSAVRGAVGFALAEALPDPSDPAFQSLVAEDKTQFGYLVPANKTPPSIIGPLPITAATCKREKDQHGIIDTLFDRLAIQCISSPEEAERVWQHRVQACRCGAQLRSASGFRGAASVPTRTVTRVAMDRARGAARDEMLFSQEMIEPGTSFEGTIRNIPPEGRERLKQALTLPLSLGRGRSAGYGQVDVSACSVPKPDALRNRGESFQNALAAYLANVNLSLPGVDVSHLVPITLLSPLSAGQPADAESVADGSALLLSKLHAKSCFLSVRRFVREGGWDQRTGRMHAFWATAAGGVFVLNLGRDWRSAVQILEGLESQGIGERRCQGYGQLLCFDPFILSRTFAR
jgi:CRISPR-associated protein Csx10